ncbi:MAG: site-specific integrase [Verrucomicrobiales bacterium]|nr:site-specific integrase [Verrucomicrobiales bacterium]
MRNSKAAKRTDADPRLSKDGRWRSFPKVPNLIQYVPNGAYYARVRSGGKLVRRALGTSSFSTAKLRLLDFTRVARTKPEPSAEPIPSLTFAQAREIYRRWLATDLTLKPKSRDYRELCLQKIATSWPELDATPVEAVTPQQCREWSGRLKLSCHYFNNVIGSLRLVFDAAIREYRRLGRPSFENPAAGIPRLRVRQKQLTLPEPGQFRALIEEVRIGSSGWGDRAADLIEFLALSGMRAFSEAHWVTWGDIDWNRNELVVRGDETTGTKNGEMRRVPILPGMAELLNRIKAKAADPSPQSRILEVRECQGALDRACEKLGIARITHHDLRHLFATRCIESGVDIPTVARWMGHKDGGALAMKTYGHLRNEHSQAMARRVQF